MDNPAITVKTTGHYAGLHWVGLFVKTATDDTNRFIAARTTNRLLPDYAERIRTYKNFEQWYNEDGAVDLTDRTITLFPKQLYGTQGDDGKVYDQFVTTNPNNDVGKKHLELVYRKKAEKATLPAFKYVWHATGKTIVNREIIDLVKLPRPVSPNPVLPILPPHSTDLDYISGIRINEVELNGWTVLLTTFGSVLKVTTGLLSGNYTAIFGGFMDLTDAFNPQKMQEEADVKGFISAAAGVVDAANKKFGTKTPTPNTTNIFVMTQNIKNQVVVVGDFGTAAYRPIL